MTLTLGLFENWGNLNWNASTVYSLRAYHYTKSCSNARIRCSSNIGYTVASCCSWRNRCTNYWTTSTKQRAYVDALCLPFYISSSFTARHFYSHCTAAPSAILLGPGRGRATARRSGSMRHGGRAADDRRLLIVIVLTGGCYCQLAYTSRLHPVSPSWHSIVTRRLRRRNGWMLTQLQIPEWS